MLILYSLLILICQQIRRTATYEVPKPELRTLQRGFSISIPHEEGIANVAFNVNINQPFQSFEEGEVSRRLIRPTDDRWTLLLHRDLSNYDTVYVWLNVQYRNSLYKRAADRLSVPSSITVTTAPHSTTPLPKTPRLEISRSSFSDPSPEKQCLPPLMTEVSQINWKKICAGDLIFEDDFNSDSLNSAVWTAETHFASMIGVEEFVLYHESNAVVENGVLHMRASLWRDKFPEISVRGALTLNNTSCKSFEHENECARVAQGQFILPPVIAGRVNTKTSFNFKYGRVEVRAKMPQGDWLFPLIALEPLAKANRPYENGQIRIAYVRGNEILSDLFGGAVFTQNAANRNRVMVKTASLTHFGQDFHRYSLTWTNTSLIMQLDGREYGHIDRDVMPRELNEESYIVLAIAAGGHGDFPDDIPQKPWRNTDPKSAFRFEKQISAWYPTWTHPELEIDYIRIYAV